MKNRMGAVMSGLKNYPKIIKHRFFGIPAPILVVFGITNRCNLKCAYCFAGLKERAGKELPSAKLIRYIDQFIELGTMDFDLQGGEPTLHPELGEFISHIVSRGAKCTVATNGFRAGNFLGDLKKCHRVCVSIDGLPETTDGHRGKGAYDIAVKALEVMSNAGINVRMHGVLTDKTTEQDIDHLVSLARKYKTNVNFVYALDTGGVKTNCGDEASFKDEVKKTASYIGKLKRRGEPITSKLGAINQVLNWPYGAQDVILEKDLDIQQRKKLKRLAIPKCLWGQLACFFNPDGKLYLCPRSFDREGFYVEIGDKTIHQAFLELTRLKSCYMCGQMGDLSYSFKFNRDNILTWLRF